MSLVMGYENLARVDESILMTLIQAEPKFFQFLKMDLKKQLAMMPENEKYKLKYDLKESKEMTEKIKNMGIELLYRNFIH